MLVDQDLVKALAHPTRVAILEALQGRVASPTMLARQMEANLGVISYHFNVLVSCDCIEEVETRQRRGALEHFFTAKPRSTIGHQDWRQAPRSLRGGVTGAAIAGFYERAVAAADAGTIDARDDTQLNWMPITVDETGWQEIVETMDKTLRLLLGIHSRSTRRLAGEPGIPVIVALAGFETPRPGGARPGGEADD